MSRITVEELVLRTADEADPKVKPLRAASGKFLTFFLADEEYGIEILKVHEIIGMMPITPVPGAAGHVKGVINLRGRVIPIVDLRLKLGMPPAEATPRSCIIVAFANGVQTGLVVDAVSEAVDIPSDDIEDAPSFGASVDTGCILGIGKCAGGIKLLLDIDKALSSQDSRQGSLREDLT